MKNISAKNLTFSLIILFALSACSEKGKNTNTAAGKSTVDSVAKAKEDSIEMQEGKEAKEVLDVVKR